MTMLNMFLSVFVVVLIATLSLSGNAFCAERLMVFAGAASKPPTEEVAKAFEAKTGVKVDISFGGSGTVLSQKQRPCSAVYRFYPLGGGKGDLSKISLPHDA